MGPQSHPLGGKVSFGEPSLTSLFRIYLHSLPSFYLLCLLVRLISALYISVSLSSQCIHVAAQQAAHKPRATKLRARWLLQFGQKSTSSPTASLLEDQSFKVLGYHRYVNSQSYHPLPSLSYAVHNQQPKALRRVGC